MNNFKKILKNENGKKMKIIARKMNSKETQWFTNKSIENRWYTKVSLYLI